MPDLNFAWSMLMNTHPAPLPVAEIEEVTLRAGGFDTRCLLAGPADAEAVVLLHDAAFGGSADVSWARIIPDLARRYRVIAPDILGFGGSDKVIFVDRSPYDFRNLHVLALLETLGVTAPVHLIGSSFGGSMGLNMLREHSARLRSVVSIAGAGGGWRTSFGREVLGAWDGTREGLKVIAETLADDSPTFDLEDHVDLRFKWACENGHYRAVVAPGVKLPAALARTAERDPFPKVPDSDTSVLLICGTRDELVQQDWPEQITPFLPHKTKTVRMESKHSPNLNMADELLGVLNDWLDSV